MRHVAAIALLLISGCQGLISEPGQDPDDPSGPGPASSASAIAPAPRIVRLTHEQWENTVRDLFYLAQQTGFSSTFPSDSNTGGYIFDNNSSSMSVDSTLWGGYQRAAGDVVDLVMADTTALAKLLPPTGDDATRARTLIEQLGKRAYRRPLTDEEINEHVALFNSAPSVYTGVPSFEAGVRLVLSAFLQSPHFLYRVERSIKASGDAIPLDGWEVASRLSYSLWNTMPDQQLFDAAAAGKLASQSGVEQEARRMLDDPRAEAVVVRFHSAVLDVWKYATKTPNPEFFPDVPAELPDYARQETELFVQNVFAEGGGYKDLLTSTETYVNADLAKLYGLSGTYGSTFERVTLDPSERRGIFTQIGFLASHATAADPDPIHRGAYLARRIACLKVAAPPDNVPPLPDANGKTNRETVEQHTEMPGSECAGCHSTYINPFGFPYENYDAVGAWRDQDSGYAVNAASAPLLDGENKPVQNAVELAEAMAESPSVHACYAKHWVEFAFGRPRAAEDEALIGSLGELSQQGASVKDMLAKLVTSRAFVNRSVKELP